VLSPCPSIANLVALCQVRVQALQTWWRCAKSVSKPCKLGGAVPSPCPSLANLVALCKVYVKALQTGLAWIVRSESWSNPSMPPAISRDLTSAGPGT